jgi:hypothetical protein
MTVVATVRMSPTAERYAEECLNLSADAANHVRVLREQHWVRRVLAPAHSRWSR